MVPVLPNIRSGNEMQQAIKVVLVNTSHPGNIGAVARAMKVMALERLVLVSPQKFPHADASARAAGASDLLAKAEVVDSLEAAIGDCQLIIGASARERHLGWPTLDPRQSAEMLTAEASAGATVAVVFGRERTGLTNSELDRCHQLLQIPANPEYSSLNIASAVQVVAYELMMASRSDQEPSEPPRERLATAEELERFYEHMEQTLIAVQFLDPDNPGLVMRRLRRLYNRARLLFSEIKVLRGIFSESQVYHDSLRNHSKRNK